jgi:hypothetical protein
MKKILLATALLSSSLLMASEKSTVVFTSLEVGFGSSKQTLSNAVSQASSSDSLSSYKLMVGSDVDLYGAGQTSRFYGSYKYSDYDRDGIDSSNTFAAGYRENMKYLSLFESGSQSMFPFAGIELGYINASDADGFSSETNLGLAYAFSDFELSLAYTYTYVNWGEPQAQTAYYDHNNQVTIGMTYKFTSEGK